MHRGEQLKVCRFYSSFSPFHEGACRKLPWAVHAMHSWWIDGVWLMSLFHAPDAWNQSSLYVLPQPTRVGTELLCVKSAFWDQSVSHTVRYRIAVLQQQQEQRKKMKKVCHSQLHLLFFKRWLLHNAWKGRNGISSVEPVMITFSLGGSACMWSHTLHSK